MENVYNLYEKNEKKSPKRLTEKKECVILKRRWNRSFFYA